MPTRKPRLFVGSSTEALNPAYSIQEGLDHDAEVTVWPQNIFEPTKGNLENLENALSNFDFAAFVLTPDDVLRIRKLEQLAARDNVVFESGLFIGKLGRDRVFLIKPRGAEDLHLPTDLAGTTTLDYDPNRSDGNMVAALGTACNRIRTKMRGWTPPPASTPLSAPSGINPHYASDLKLLDENFQVSNLITPETILVITGTGVIAELLDRPCAAILRENIDSLGQNRPHRRGILLSDTLWLSNPNLKLCPVISVGGPPANQASKAILEGSAEKSRWKRDGGILGAFWRRDNVPLVALWGDTALSTRKSVEHYLTKGLLDFVSMCWK
jgi:hypothetical protein